MKSYIITYSVGGSDTKQTTIVAKAQDDAMRQFLVSTSSDVRLISIIEGK
jgi:hypothetical protein